ncbi:hypothetical protein SOCEGT47_032460 [Sorangium cellulosum]|uniref:Uncharacterized protein n=1 Tax=Sorangium cellulosum TaxID=56 RepID=A0A4P2Q0M8_SORCE|nr:hypothetical protein [Sorangium cellulosum]AUX22739.1 hypothetical protein SOCEGT47_032460 [Sorangium cellulosum]
MARPPKAAPAPILPTSPAAALAAYGRVEPKLLELGPDDLVTVYVEVPKAVSSVLGALPHLREMRDEIVRDLPNHPIETLDELEDYALAAWYADLLYSTPANELDTKKLTEDAAGLREGLLVAAEALAYRDLLDKQRVADIRKGKGHTDLASDLIALAELFRGSWDKVRAKTAVEDVELDRAADLGVRLLAALAAKPGKGSSAAPKITDAADRRARAISLVARAYEECRRAVAYLRWHEGGDGDLAPSLLQKPRGRRPNAEKAAAAAAAASEAAAKPSADEAPAAADGALPPASPANDAGPVATA